MLPRNDTVRTFHNGNAVDVTIAALIDSDIVSLTASRTAEKADIGNILHSQNGATDVVYTIPPRASLDLNNAKIILVQIDSGLFTVTPGSGVTLNGGVVAISLAGQFKSAFLYESGLNNWYLIGG